MALACWRAVIKFRHGRWLTCPVEIERVMVSHSPAQATLSWPRITLRCPGDPSVVYAILWQPEVVVQPNGNLQVDGVDGPPTSLSRRRSIWTLQLLTPVGISATTDGPPDERAERA